MPTDPLDGARLLYAYTMHIEAPLQEAFRFTGDPEYWARDYEGEQQPSVALVWEGPAYRPGSIMVLSPLRKDGTPTASGAVRMELLRYKERAELSFRFLTGNHIIYRFFYEQDSPHGTEFTVNAYVGGQSPMINTLRQRLYAGRRRKASIQDHLRVKAQLEAKARRRDRSVER